MERKSLALASMVLTTLLLTGCPGGGGGSSSNNSSNLVPIANAGAGQVVTSGTIVTLDGSASSDPDGFITNYAWTQTGGTPAVALSSSTVAKPTFAAPNVAALTTLTFTLIVTDGVGVQSLATTTTVAVSPTPVGNVTGRVRFMRIPATTNGLNYAAGQLQPARAIMVLAVTPGSRDPNPQNALASTSTITDGTFTLNVPGNTNFNVLVVARMLRDTTQTLPHWDFRSLDMDAANPTPYVYTDAQSYNSGNAANIALDIPSGFDATGAVTGTRASAPFAVLDTVFQGAQLVLSVAPNTDFPPLILDWAADNPGSETFFDPSGSQHITLSADVTEDTDEFDQHVIAHEFGHYIEHNFSRADNIGGSHGLGDKLDIRVAFGEGFGYAFGAIVLGDPVTHDTFVFNGAQMSSTFNVEQNPSTTPAGASPPGNFGCWCSESSVWSILWDIYDTVPDGSDNVALGFQPMWNVLTNEERTTHAFTSIFTFIRALKAANPASAAAINTLIAAQNIDGANLDDYGTGETHVPAPVAAAAALPLYTAITVGGGPVVLRNVDDAGTYNTLGNHRFLRFTLNSARTITISASSSNPNNADPDFVVYRDGSPVSAGEDPPPQPETETLTNAAAGDYLIDVYDCANGCSGQQGTPGDYDITVTVN